MIPQFNIRKGSAGGAGGFDSIDTITSTPIEVSDFPPANPSMDGDELGYDLSRAGEGLFIRNYFAKFTDPHFHKEKELVTATCTFEDHRRRATADGRVLQKKMILATGASNGVVKLWNILKGKFVKDLIFHSAKIKSIAYFDMPGGNTRIITGSEDKTVAIWDFNSGTVFKHFTRNDAIHCLAVCQKTGILVVGTADRKIAVYDIKSERVADIVNVADFETIHTDLILSLAILASDDKKESIRIVSVGWDKRMVVWDCFGKNIDQFEKGHTKSITALVAHTPSGEESSGVDLAPILITGSLDKTVIVWDFGTLKKIRVLEGHKGQVTAVKVSDRDDDGSPPIVITASLDKMLILWDLLSGYRVRTIEYSEPLNTLAIIDSIDGIIAISSGNSPFLLTWDLRRTHRTRKFVTGAVTAIDVYTPPNNGTPQVIIGAVDRKFTVFDYNDSKNYLTQHDYHTKRINAGVIYTPLTNVPNPGLPPTPLVVSADGNADIKVWTLDVANGPVVKKNLSGHKFVVLTVAVYDPTLYGRVRETSFERDRLSDATVKVDLRVPCVLSGGADKTIKVWDFLGVLGKGDLIAEISAAHNANVRSIVVHHPMNPAEKPSFISGSYDLTTTLWDLETLTKIRVFRGIHTDYVFFTALYDPRTQYIPTGDLPAHKQNPAVITSSYDFSFAVWDMHTGALRYHKTEAHRDSVTALAVYTPPFASSDDPLVITGSIDRMIHIWNLFTGEKVQTLVGHADRVCYIKVYEPPGQHPVILSGGDDEQTIVWEDSLYQKPFMPLRESVIRAFEADFEKIDWPMITEMAEIYGGELFVENSNLFTIAVLKDRADFLLKFWEYLTLTLPTIKPEEIESGSGVFFDILSIAIKRCDLTSVRAIVLSWIKNLNQDMDNMLTQRVYHPSYFFPEDVLELLYKYYPSEFLHFINSLKLIRNFQGLMGGKQRKYLSSSSRYEFQGSASRVDTYQDIWENFDPTSTYSPGKGFAEKQNWFDRALIQLDRQIIQAYQSFSRFFEVKIEPQPVTSMMVPFKDCNNAYRYLKKFVDVSNQLDDVSIFDSEIGIVFLRYFWHIRGRGTHMLAFFKYILFSIIFLVVIYSYEENYHRYPAISALSGICIGGFAWYGYEEFSQMRKMLGAFTVHNLITHIADLWNAVDLVIVVNGIIGLVLRLAYDRDTPTGRSCLAVTSVFMWFKILYFLRPFSSTGPLVAMILQIASEIRTFLFVLFCVLAGYAQAFWLLSNNDETLVFGTVSNAFLNAFLYMLGQNVSAEFSGTASPYVAQVFLIFFLITMMILMLNLLIALMGDVFSKVRSEGVALWRKEQAAIILEESFLYMNDTSIPKHLLVLKYTSEVTKSTMNYEEELENLIATSDVPKFTPFSLKGAKTVEDDEDGEDGSKADQKK